MSDDGSGFIFMLGFIVGASGVLMMGLSMKIAMRRNLKEYLFSLSPDSRKIIDDDLQTLYDLTENMAIKTNTRLLKTIHNDFVQLRAYLLSLWKQN
jgi:hypothetical protein